MPTPRRTNADAQYQEPERETTIEAPFETSVEAPPEEQRTDWVPRPKVATGGAVGTPLAIVLIWAAGEAGIEIDMDVALSLAGLLIVAVGYLTPER